MLPHMCIKSPRLLNILSQPLCIDGKVAMVLLVILHCFSVLIKVNPCPHMSETNFSCLCRYLCFCNEVCVLNPLPQSLQNLYRTCILSFWSSLCEIFLLSSIVEPCLWHVLEMSVLSSVVSSKVSDVSGMCLFSSAVLFFVSDVSEIPLLFSVVSSSLFIWFHLSIEVLCLMEQNFLLRNFPFEVEG